MTGCPGVFAGGDMVPSERTVTVGVGPRQEGRPPHRRLAARRAPPRAAPKHDRGDLRQAAPLVLRRRRPPRSSPSSRPRSASPDFGEVVGGLSAEEARLRGRPVPVVRQLLRVRRLPRRLPGGRRDQARRRATATGSTTTAAPAAAPATSSARCTRSRWSRSPADARDDRRQRGRGLGRLPAQRGLLHLPDHAVLADGRAGRRVVEPGPAERLGHRADGRRDAERGRRGRRAARRAAERRAGDDVHRLAGPAADDPEHVQDRRRADAGGAARRRPVAGGAGAVDLRRPLGRDGGAADRLRAARLGVGAGGARPGAGRAGRDAARRACRSCTSSTGSAPRTS